MDSCAGQDSRVSQLSDLSQYHSDTLILAAKVDDFYNKLNASEQKCLSKAVDSRRREFSTGRWLPTMDWSDLESRMLRFSLAITGSQFGLMA